MFVLFWQECVCGAERTLLIEQSTFHKSLYRKVIDAVAFVMRSAARLYPMVVNMESYQAKIADGTQYDPAVHHVA